MVDIEVQKHSVHTLVFRSLKRTHDMFISDQGQLPPPDEKSDKIRFACKVSDEYKLVKHMRKDEYRLGIPAVEPTNGEAHLPEIEWTENGVETITETGPHDFPSGPGVALSAGGQAVTASETSTALVKVDPSITAASVTDIQNHASNTERFLPQGNNKALVTIGGQQLLVPRKATTMPKPNWHPPWKLFRVVSGHLGWVRCVDFEPGNEWFVTGSSDRVIKIWDLANCTLKLSLTGHISTVRGVKVSNRQPYLFSCGEDKQVKCWDLEYNKVNRHYHGHLSAVYGIDLHPTIDVIATCGRDATIRIWDMRTKACIHTLTGHTNTVADVRCQSSEPQIVSGSHDCTIRLWDLAAGKSQVTLTNHKKSVRSVAIHPSQNCMISASPDNVKQWKFPDGNFLQNFSGHNAIVNTVAVNEDGVVVTGGDNGSLYFWDWKTGYNFQRLHTQVQPGSIDSEAGIFAVNFDKSGSRLFTCEADKSIKIYKEDDSATEESHPINWRPEIVKKRKY